MGIYLPNMEMPKSCCECILAKLSPTGETLICNYNLPTVPWDETPFDCPLVPVPPHGRLIDADALANKHRTMAYEDGGRKYSFHASAKAWVEEAPTIIPAQTEKEGE